MNIHYYHQFFAGPDAPGPAQPRKLVEYLAVRGHHIDVVACDFNTYNEQDEPIESRTSGRGRITVHRLKTPRGIRKSLQARLNSYGRFAFAANRYARSLPTPDVIMASIQPLFGGYAAYRNAKRFKRPFLLEIRDLWPDALVVKGAISKWQAAPLQWMAHQLYQGADRIVSLTPGIKTELLKKQIPAHKIDLFPNGYEAAAFALPGDARTKTREQYGWNDTFVAGYTGTHTEVTAIDVIVRAAEALQHRPDVRVDLFGSGQSKASCMTLARSLNLSNIHFHDPVSKSAVPSIIAGADAGIMTLFQSPLAHIYFENKLIDYMGSCKPIAAAMDGVQSDIIRNSEAGVVVGSGDAEGLANGIQSLADAPETATAMGRRGHDWVCDRLRQEVICEHYALTLERMADGRIAQHSTWDPFA